MNVKDLVIVGAGGFSREAAEAARACAAAGAAWRVAGFVDDAERLAGAVIDGLPVIGKIDDVRPRADVLLAVGIGRPDNYVARMTVVERLALDPSRYAIIVHPGASLGATTTVGEGTIVLAHAVATASVTIGKHVAVMPHVTLTHDDVVDDYVSLAAGVRVGGGVHIGRGAYIGAGAMVREEVTVGEWAMVGMGSVVTKDVPPGELWLGSPARYRRAAPVPPEILEGAT